MAHLFFWRKEAFPVKRILFFTSLFIMLSPSWPHAQSMAWVRFAQGLHLYQEGNLENALPHLRQAVAQAPQNADFQFYLGATLVQLERYREAVEPLQQSLALRPNFPLSQFFLGASHFHLDQLEEARGLLNQGPDEEPMKHLYLGLIEFRNKRYAEAISFLEKAVALDETLSGQVSYHLGVANYHLHHFDESNSHFLTTIQRGVETPYSTNAREFLQLPELLPEERRKRVNDFWITLTMDDNVVVEPEDANFAFGLSNKGDVRGGIAFNGWRRYQAARHFSIIPSYFFYRTIHQSFGEFDLSSFRGGIELEYNLKSFGIEVEGFYNYNFLQDDSYFRSTGVRITPFIDRGQLSLAADFSWSDNRYFQLSPRTGETRQAGLWGSYNFSFRRQGGIRLGYQHLNVNARADFSYDGDRYSAQLTLFLPWKLVLVPSVTFYDNDYEAPSSLGSAVPAFGIVRDDDGITYDLSLFRQLNQQTFVNVSFSSTAHDSNISFYEYDRQLFTLGFLFRL